MTTTNPFHRPVVARPDHDEAGELEPDTLWDDAIMLTGPATAPPVPTEHHPVTGWDTVEVIGAPTVCVMSLHGGAGGSTLTTLLGEGALDVGTAWPVAGGWAHPLPVLDVVAVARTHHRGLEAADRLAHLWAAGSLPNSRLVGLVLVDDAPHLTTAQRKSVRRLARMTPHGWHLPWQEAWRLTTPELPSTPLRVRRVSKSIHKIVHNKENH